MMRIFHLFMLSVLLGAAGQVQANHNRISVDYIRGESEVEGVKLAFQHHTDLLKQYSPLLGLYFESSFNLWEYGEFNSHDSNFVLAVSPVLQYEIGTVSQNRVFLEFGIGISLIDDTQFAGKNVSTHYQFEDRLGLAYKFGRDEKYSVALRYFHYSNAGFKKPNPGLDFISLSLAVKL